MSRTVRRGAFALLATSVLSLPPAQAADPAPSGSGSFTATVAGFVDDADGTSLDLDLGWQPTAWLGLNAGFGNAESSSDLADLSGDSLRAGIDVHGRALGARLDWRKWQDDGQFESDTLGGELYWSGGGWSVGLLLEQRDFTVDYTVTILNRTVERSVSFDGVGVGAQATWSGERWNGYLRGVSYDYDDTLDRVLAAAQQPNLARFPRIQALVGSLLTRSASAIDHDVGVGIERAFQRSGLRLDVALSRDAISGADSRSVSVGWRYALSPRFDLDATIGQSDSDDLDGVGYAGLALTFRN